MYEFASSSATLLTVYTAAMHTRRMNVIPEAELWNYDSYLSGARCRMAQLMPLPTLTVSCFSEIQISLTFLVPAHPGSPRKGLLNGCVCVCVKGNTTTFITCQWQQHGL